MSAAAVFDAAFRRAEAGQHAAFTIRHADGGVHAFKPADWCRETLPGDHGLIERCAGATLDVGCGPGRLAVALALRGLPALGIDISAAAVRLARRRGATALRRDVFGPVPGAGRWRHLLLADGNVGIGGDPRRLLRRCRTLLSPSGRVHVELSAPGTASWCGPATVPGPGGLSLPWATVAPGDLPGLAAGAELRVTGSWTEAGRWFATLSRA